MKVEFYRHNIGEKEIKELNRILHSLFLTTGNETALFEDRLARYLGSKKVVGVNSCTAGLHISLIGLGIGPGDEVITTPLSFYATSNAILYAGATPIFVDVEKNTGQIDANLIEKAISKKTKAIIPVHMYGQMCDMIAISRIAKKHKLKVIEDAALCVEGKIGGKRPAYYSDTACFSFHAIKSITSGEGGAIATNNSLLAKKLKLLRLHGMGKSVIDRSNDKLKKQDMSILGYKCNMYDLQAALLINQLKNIDSLFKKRKSACLKYEQAFRKNPQIRLPETKKHYTSAMTMFPIWVNPKKRDGYLVKLQEMGVGVDVKYRTIHLSTYYKKKFKFKKGDFPMAEEISDSTITLPLYPKLKKDELNYVIKCVNTVVKG